MYNVKYVIHCKKMSCPKTSLGSFTITVTVINHQKTFIITVSVELFRCFGTPHFFIVYNYDKCITVILLFSVYLTVSLYFYEMKVLIDHISLHRGEGGAKKNNRM